MFARIPDFRMHHPKTGLEKPPEKGIAPTASQKSLFPKFFQGTTTSSATTVPYFFRIRSMQMNRGGNMPDRCPIMGYFKPMNPALCIKKSVIHSSVEG
jgi:hypothetical protein